MSLTIAGGASPNPGPMQLFLGGAFAAVLRDLLSSLLTDLLQRPLHPPGHLSKQGRTLVAATIFTSVFQSLQVVPMARLHDNLAVLS